MSIKDGSFSDDADASTCPVCGEIVLDGHAYTTTDDKERAHTECCAFLCPVCEALIRKNERYLLIDYPEYVEDSAYVHEDCRDDCAHDYDHGICFICGFVKAREHEKQPKARIR